MELDIVALLIISLGGIVGFIMLRYFLFKKHIPKGLSLIHGALMLLGLIALLIYNLTTSNDHKHWMSFSIFLFAIIFGLWAVLSDVSKYKHYRKVIYAHILIGVGGIGVLYLHVLGGA